MDFSEWFDRIDQLCRHMYGLSIVDLPDMPFRIAYEDGGSPEGFIADNIPDLDALKELILG